MEIFDTPTYPANDEEFDISKMFEESPPQTPTEITGNRADEFFPDHGEPPSYETVMDAEKKKLDHEKVKMQQEREAFEREKRKLDLERKKIDAMKL